MVLKMTLDEALKEALQDDDKVSQYEAKVLKEIIMADGHVSDEERETLRKALSANTFDEQAFRLLSDILLRADMEAEGKKPKNRWSKGANL